MKILKKHPHDTMIFFCTYTHSLTNANHKRYIYRLGLAWCILKLKCNSTSHKIIINCIFSDLFFFFLFGWRLYNHKTIEISSFIAAQYLRCHSIKCTMFFILQQFIICFFLCVFIYLCVCVCVCSNSKKSEKEKVQ